MAGDAGGDGDDEVGYGKPPRHSRFPPGQSGNPGGRPRGPQSLARDLYEELQEAVPLEEETGGEPRSLSKQRTILRGLTARAIAGDPKATVLVLDLVQRLIGAGPSPEPALAEPEEDDDWEGDPREFLAAKIEEIARRLGTDRPEGEDESPPGESEDGP